MVGDIKNIVVIQSLSKIDKKTGAELYDDTIRQKIEYTQPEAIKMTHSYHDIPNKLFLIEILRYYCTNSEYMNGGILIHFEMHGSENKEGLILADNSFISWSEITDLLRIININSNNKLYITMATCYGRYIFKGMDLDKKTPFSGYISASKEVIVEEVLGDFTLLFETLIQSGNLVYSYLELEKKGSNFYYKDSKAIFEENFKAFKENPEFKKQILESAKKNVIEKNGIEEINEETANYIYENKLNDIYQIQRNSFLFK